MDLKCRDKFLVQSVLISSDLEFSNVQTIVCRDSPLSGYQPVLAQTLTLPATIVGVRGEVSGPGEEDKSQLPPCRGHRALCCRSYSHQAAAPHQRRKSPCLISNPHPLPIGTTVTCSHRTLRPSKRLRPHTPRRKSTDRLAATRRRLKYLANPRTIRTSPRRSASHHRCHTTSN